MLLLLTLAVWRLSPDSAVIQWTDLLHNDSNLSLDEMQIVWSDLAPSDDRRAWWLEGG